MGWQSPEVMIRSPLLIQHLGGASTPDHAVISLLASEMRPQAPHPCSLSLSIATSGPHNSSCMMGNTTSSTFFLLSHLAFPQSDFTVCGRCRESLLPISTHASSDIVTKTCCKVTRTDTVPYLAIPNTGGGLYRRKLCRQPV